MKELKNKFCKVYSCPNFFFQFFNEFLHEFNNANYFLTRVNQGIVQLVLFHYHGNAMYHLKYDTICLPQCMIDNKRQQLNQLALIFYSSFRGTYIIIIITIIVDSTTCLVFRKKPTFRFYIDTNKCYQLSKSSL